MTAVETTKERWFEVEVNRVAGEISLKSPKPDAAKAEGYFDRAAGAAGKVMGATRRDEHGSALA